jgi:GPI ethanolamine phosphate transferase 3 subunit O
LPTPLSHWFSVFSFSSHNHTTFHTTILSLSVVGWQTNKMITSRYLLQASLWFASLFGIYWFVTSFFLSKQSLSHVSQCDEATALLRDTLRLSEHDIAFLQTHGGLASPAQHTRPGCWMNRTVDSVLLVVVDALRFDFALYDLPRSVGHRISHHQGNLYQFVADPPTVTVQRLKALTTGGLPTFADLSTNFGGADVADDSWISRLKGTDAASRGLSYPSRLAYVGDDTWSDLYPHSFDIALPFPSFNTRDLNTVDNGCLHHMPDLLSHVRSATRPPQPDDLEVLIIHFLGVDHVGHTYGPFNEHMTRKLNQMDEAMVQLLERVDNEPSCQMALIMGDHGMTADGNHGGGTPEETNAALFVYASPACGYNTTRTEALPTDSSAWMQEAFPSIHQIDFVPTLSMLLGLPIPFANAGMLISELLPPAHRATALALNAAQLWRYFEEYSQTAQRLPDLPVLQSQLDTAAKAFSHAIAQTQSDHGLLEDRFTEASLHFRSFGEDALEMAQRVWTKFDISGMICGIAMLVAITTVLAWPLRSEPWPPSSHFAEYALSCLFLAYHSILLSFSNSYIYEEETSMMFSLAVLSLLVARRLYQVGSRQLWRGILLIPIAGRCATLFISGHGLDPSLQIHIAHHPVIFLLALSLLGGLRWHLYRQHVTHVGIDVYFDILAMICIAISWLEKRSSDTELTGYFMCQLSILSTFLGVLSIILRPWIKKSKGVEPGDVVESTALTVLTKLFVGLLIVTGPSSSSSLIVYVIQALCMYSLSKRLPAAADGVTSFVLVVMWKFITREVFFATNHAFAFNRVHYSAAFVAHEEFHFTLSGSAVLLNTFGWEIVGLFLAWMFSRKPGRRNLWRMYGVCQMIEITASCISVSMLRRHLMVWDIYAPHFVFVAINTSLCIVAQIIVALSGCL